MASVVVPSGNYTIVAAMDATGCGGCSTQTVGSASATQAVCGGGTPTLGGTVTIDKTKTVGGKNSFTVSEDFTTAKGFTQKGKADVIVTNNSGGLVYRATIAPVGTNVSYSNIGSGVLAGTYSVNVLVPFVDANNTVSYVCNKAYTFTVTK